MAPDHLESLSERYKILRRFDAGNGIQIPAEIDADRPNLRVVAEAKTDVIRVAAGELIRVDAAVDVAAVVENHAAQIVDQLNRKTRF